MMVFVDASPIAMLVLEGYDVCIFSYGQIGTGKSYTMGAPTRILEQVFTIAKERSVTLTFYVSVIVLEVYNEQIRDLLNTSPTPK